jgi:hypothetical protein
VTVLGPPVNTVRPSISGGAAAGSLLRCSQGTWTNNPTAYAYTWHRGASTIAGATTSSYRTTGADQGRALSCSVTATNLAGSSTADSRSINVPAALAATGGPRDVVLEKGPAGSFRIKVQYVLRTTVCGKTCRATAEIRVRNGSRIYYSNVATKLPGDGKVVLGTRSGLKLPAGKKVYFYLTVSKAALLRAPFKTIGAYRVANTRLRVWLLTPKGRLLTVRDGHIKVSIARIRSGALPGLKGVL